MAYGYITPYRSYSDNRSGGWGSNMLFDLNRQINRLFEDIFEDEEDGSARSSNAFSGARGNRPLMDVSRIDEGYRMDVELPGVKKDDVDLRVEDGVLQISGEKNRSFEDDDDGWRERSHGKFERKVALPRQVDSDNIEADYEDGILKIFLPFTEESDRGRKIELGSRKFDDNRLIDDDSTKIEENA